MKWTRTRTSQSLIMAGLLVLAGFGALTFVVRLDAQFFGSELISYTTAQADRGQSVYAEQCASCHGPNLDDGAFAPPLLGVAFRQKWGSQPIDALFTQTSTRMPPGAPGSLGDQRYADLLAC